MPVALAPRDRELGSVSAMPSQPVLDHVQIAAPRGCEAEARRFDGDVLGLPELEKPSLYVVVAELGSLWVMGNCTSALRSRSLPPGKLIPLSVGTKPDWSSSPSGCRTQDPLFDGTTTCRTSVASSPMTPGATAWSSWPTEPSDLLRGNTATISRETCLGRRRHPRPDDYLPPMRGERNRRDR